MRGKAGEGTANVHGEFSVCFIYLTSELPFQSSLELTENYHHGAETAPIVYIWGLFITVCFISLDHIGVRSVLETGF